MASWNFDDRKILVTAGGSGIGKTIAAAFLANGAQVHICDVDRSAIDTFLEEHGDAGRATATVADVSDPRAVDTVFAELSATTNSLDVLINNAGVAGPTARVEDIDPDDWNHCLGVDLNGPFHCTRRAVPLLRKRGGSIINIASNAGLFGFPLRSAYAASKWGLIGLTKTWAMELGADAIRVNAICPGSVEGPRIESVIKRDAQERGLSTEQIRKIYLQQTSLKRFVEAQDVANMALFLASDLGRNVSGQALGVDGHTEGLSNAFDPVV